MEESKENLLDNLDDLNLFLDNSPEALEASEKVKEITNDINLLDTEKVPENNLRNPGEILKDYSNIEKEKTNIQIEIDEFKQKHLDIFEQYQALLDKYTEASNRQNDLKPEMTEAMENAGLKNIADDLFKVTFVAATSRENFDKKSFEKKYPVLYKQFITKSEVSAYVKFTNNK